MAANAQILVTLDKGKVQEVSQRLRTVFGTNSLEATGAFDVMVDLEADTPEDITAIVRNKIRPIHGVVSVVVNTYM